MSLPPARWICPQCEQGVELEVPVSEEPWCCAKDKHLKPVKMMVNPLTPAERQRRSRATKRQVTA